jgi:ATP-dependent exoDNAse (exonuclease V) alpha subunit
MMPKEDNIIIDEVGMLDSEMNNLIVKCALIGKKIYSFGDFKQLKPVKGEICNSEIYLNYIYNNICKLGTNYRNDFTFDYYEKLIGMTEYEDILEEIQKYNHKNYYEAETIITYTNKTKDKYNQLMIERLGLKFGDVGCRIVCKKNDLKDLNIYNNFYYTIKERDDDIIVITDGIDNIEIKEKQLINNFELGYCRTLYNIQGESIKSFYFCLEDTPHIDGRALYTLISRLKK